MTKRSLKNWNRILTAPLVVAAALVVFVEDVLWARLNQLLAWTGKLPVLRVIERLISTLPPYAALPLFLVPVVTLLPFKLGALWLIAHGHAIAGVQVFILAKVVGTALAARIFMLTRPALMSLAWFARGFNWLMALRVRIYHALHQLPVYQRTRAFIARVRSFITRSRGGGSTGYLKRRWQALRRLRRKST